MLQKMVRIVRKDGEQLPDFMRRLRTSIGHLKTVHRFEDWDRWYYRAFFKWAGHVARFMSYDPCRIAYRALKHFDWQRISEIADENQGSQLHGHRLHVWRWERPLYTYFKESSWQEAAQDKGAWQTQLDEMVKWRCREH